MSNKLVLIALNRLPGIGPKTIQRILYHWPQLNEMLEQHALHRLSPALPPALAQAFYYLDWQKAEQDLRWSEQESCHILTYDDAQYPALLRQIHNAPPVLYLKGDLGTLKETTLAVVGTRKPSSYGQRIARQWCEQLVDAGLVLVSGMALGIDTIVHQVCVAKSGKTIAVMGCGLQHTYPRQNRILARQIEQNGLIISEFSPELPPNPGHFPRRNRIISGLALCTLIVESAEKSGTMHTAMHAVEQNREVFAIPGPVGEPQSLGCHRLIQQGARLVVDASEIIAQYHGHL